ncbi:mammalian cell entry protein, partial [Burkholderia cenocepacia]|nr:mammalian cell entry protein [Burkholderia cenocepacia]
MNSPQGSQHDAPRPPDPAISTKSGWLPSLVWLVPLIAALIGIGLVIKSVRERGPEI